VRSSADRADSERYGCQAPKVDANQLDRDVVVTEPSNLVKPRGVIVVIGDRGQTTRRKMA
jgi:hypothetical protein